MLTGAVRAIRESEAWHTSPVSFIAKLQRGREILEQQRRLSVRALGRCDAWRRWAAIDPSVAEMLALVPRMEDAFNAQDEEALRATVREDLQFVDRRRTGMGMLDLDWIDDYTVTLNDPALIPRRARDGA